MQLLAQPAGQAPAWRRPASTPTQQALAWWHADLREDHKYTGSDEDQKTATLGGILAEEIQETPGKTLAGDNCNVMARPLPGPRQDPC